MSAATHPGPRANWNTDIVGHVRNMDNMKTVRSRTPSSSVEPKGTVRRPYLSKASTGPRVPGGSQTRSYIDSTVENELRNAQYLFEDLPDQMFRHLVSVDLAKDILGHFIATGIVTVSGVKTRSENAFDADGVQGALAEAAQDAIEHGLCPSGSQESTAWRKRTKKTTYSWTWTKFPPVPIDEDLLVNFINSVINRAFAFAHSQSCIVAPHNYLRHRFAAPPDKHHPLLLPYEADGEDMRPDFLLLPAEAFAPDSNKVDEKYLNFTAVRAVGESKTSDMSLNVPRVHRYLRGIRRSQPWLHFVIGLILTKDKAALLRGDSSGTERVLLTLSTGRGCRELIRILLGLALADPVDLGQNPDVELDSEVRSCRIADPVRKPPTGATRLRLLPASAPTHPENTRRRMATRVQSLAIAKPPPFIPSTSLTTSIGSVDSTSSELSTRSKRHRRKTDDQTDYEERPAKKQKMSVDRRIFYPLKLHGHVCLGPLYTVISICGRCTVVFAVSEIGSLGRLLALKMSWQDAARLADQEKVLERLAQRGGHPNAIMPHKHFKALRKGQECSTLHAIRGFLEHQVAGFEVENRFLIVSLSDLKRPVKYFWGVHDFVRGLRGALIGHKYLVSIGVLHRDFSENNMVLALRPGGERGYIIDPDMAILYEHEAEPEEKPSPKPDTLWRPGDKTKSEVPLKQDATKPVKGLRTHKGTTPYMSFNVLFGRRHTEFDDVESFLYVLFLFFFSYFGPLSKEELEEADTNRFVESVGSGRLRHMTSWPPKYAAWTEGDFNHIATEKYTALSRRDAALILVQSPEVQTCLEQWPSELHEAIQTILLSAWNLFSTSIVRGGPTKVSHDQFIHLLDVWLRGFSDLEESFSNCPFSPESLSTSSVSTGE